MPRIKDGMAGTSAEGDMTSMIDMTFQLIAFFMVLINFADENANKKIKIPASSLAVPPKTPPLDPILIQINYDGRVQYAGTNPQAWTDVIPKLRAKQEQLNLKDKREGKEEGTSVKEAHVILRADYRTPAIEVRKVINFCQENIGFEGFAFRANQKTREAKGRRE